MKEKNVLSKILGIILAFAILLIAYKTLSTTSFLGLLILGLVFWVASLENKIRRLEQAEKERWGKEDPELVE